MSMNRRRTHSRWFIIFALATIAPQARAEDAFYRTPLADLKLTEGKLSDAEGGVEEKRPTFDARFAMQPRVVLDGQGEAYIEQSDRYVPQLLRLEGALVARAPAGRDLTGSLYLPKDHYSGMVKLRFVIPSSAGGKNGDRFNRAKMEHYESLLGRDIPGTAWFRHQYRAAQAELGKPQSDDVWPTSWNRAAGIEETFDLFSGGRAVRENLQLDRDLLVVGKNDEPVDVSSLEGITIAEIDWKPLLARLDRLPLGMHVAVGDPWKLTAVLTALRALIEQTAPKMTVWESLDYRDEPYVRVGPSKRAEGELPREFGRPSLYHSFSAEGLLVTFNEGLLKRAIDRQLVRRQVKKEGKPLPVDERPWLGTSLCFQFDRRLLKLFELFSADELRQTLQSRSWANLPVLNEWRGRYPDRDPVQVHEAFWQTRPVCPGGGEYVWNEQWQTMESTVYGHPGEPKPGPISNLPLSDLIGGNFGLTFEKQGLRAKAVLDRDAKHTVRVGH